MLQLQEQVLQPTDQMMPHMNHNLNYVNPVNMQQMLPTQPNMLMNGNIQPIPMQMNMPNNQQNQDTSKFFIFYYLFFYRKTSSLKT